MYGILVALFDALERVISKVDNGWREAWRRFRDGPLQTFLFALIITITGVFILVKALLEELDDLLAGLEKAVISVALLAMTGLSFLDYLRREVPGVDYSIQGGASMAVVLMVWVGFLGASLATRQRKHLSVDASDRILSSGSPPDEAIQWTRGRRVLLDLLGSRNRPDGRGTGRGRRPRGAPRSGTGWWLPSTCWAN